MQFCTYPRTGVNFITESIKMQTGIMIKHSHNEFVEDDILINIVRDPLESIASWICLGLFREDLSIKNNGIEKVVNLIAKNKYINMYKILLSKNTIFIDYKDINNIKKLMPKLCKILKIEIINELNENQIKEINLERSKVFNAQYLITSKAEPKYKEVYETLEKIDFSKCYALYHEALDRCIKI